MTTSFLKQPVDGAETTVEADATALFDDDLIPVIRELGERGRGVTEPISEEDAAARQTVWRSLAALGALRSGVGDGTPLLRETARLAELMGHALYQSPYFDTLTAADLIAAGAPAGLDETLAGIAAGDTVIAVAARDDGRADLRWPGPIDIDADAGLISGERRFVTFAADVDLILVVGQTGAALTAVLVPRAQPGVVVRRQDDIGCGELYQVEFDRASFLAVGPCVPGTPGPTGGWEAAWAAALARARLRHASYLVGLCLGAVELSADYARRRQVFGQALAKFQAPVFRLAEFTARAEAVRSLLTQTCADADAGADVALPACQALLLASELSTEAAADAIQIHGSYGLTSPCDAQRFYRRAVVDGILLGTGRNLRRHALDLLPARGA